MCSGNGTNFENIVNNCPDHQVEVMIHNIKDCGAVERAKDLEFHMQDANQQKKIRLFLF